MFSGTILSIYTIVNTKTIRTKSICELRENGANIGQDPALTVSPAGIITDIYLANCLFFLYNLFTFVWFGNTLFHTDLIIKLFC